jgi:hypothetical protein
MLYLLALVVVVITLVAIVRSHRGAPNSSLTKNAVRVGAIISVVRLGLFWGGFALYNSHHDWRQTVGYALLILNSVAELAIAGALSGKRSGPSLLVATLIVLTSAALGLALAWIRARLASRDGPRSTHKV